MELNLFATLCNVVSLFDPLSETVDIFNNSGETMSSVFPSLVLKRYYLLRVFDIFYNGSIIRYVKYFFVRVLVVEVMCILSPPKRPLQALMMMMTMTLFKLR